jgi:hypothetical protein
MRHLYKVVALLALLLLVVGIYRKSTELERSDLGFDLPVAAAVATDSSSSVVTPSGLLGAARPARALNTVPSEAAWSQAIDTVLRDNSDATEKSRRMLQMLPHLPPALQAEAAQHLVNFATDSTCENVVEPLLNTKTDHSAQAVLLIGLLQRADKIRLPALLQIARNPEHAKHPDALRYLHFLLESDDPADSAAWEARIESRLKPPSG